MPHLDVFWYHFNIQKTMPQNTFPTFFPYIFYIKKSFLQKQKSFQKTQICFTNGIDCRKISDLLPPPWGSFGCHKNIHTVTSRKRYAQKMSGCYTVDNDKNKSTMFLLIACNPFVFFTQSQIFPLIM